MPPKRPSPTHGSGAPLKKDKVAGDDPDFSWHLDAVRKVFIGRFLTGAPPGSRIAAFDFDGTLSVPKSGKTFPENGRDFRLLDQRLKQRVKEITVDRSFIIFTNQMGIGKHTTIQEVADRIAGILKLIAIPCTIFASTAENEYRKPRRGMFDLLQQEYNAGIGISCSESLFVGDAAGRKKSSTGPKDHSAADFLFSLNCNINFLTPEQFLAGQSIESAQQQNKQSLPRPSYQPQQWLSPSNPFAFDLNHDKEIPDEEAFIAEWKKICDRTRVIVVLVGIPGSGKSHFIQRFCSGWLIISRDKSGTMAKCEKELNAVIEQSSVGRVVIDNTNFDAESRTRWLLIARNKKWTPVAVWMDVAVEQAHHNNAFRRLVALRSGEEFAQMVPNFVISKQAKELVPPSLSEGFDEVFRISFSPDFPDESLRKLYTCYL